MPARPPGGVRALSFTAQCTDKKETPRRTRPGERSGTRTTAETAETAEPEPGSSNSRTVNTRFTWGFPNGYAPWKRPHVLVLISAFSAFSAVNSVPAIRDRPAVVVIAEKSHKNLYQRPYSLTRMDTLGQNTRPLIGIKIKVGIKRSESGVLP
jgi:hypothetical protein